MADLHPIVIPPFEHIHKSLKFTCAGEGLYKDHWLYDPYPETFFPPKATKTNSNLKEVEKKPTAYWKAQCAFRGLNQSGAIGDLQLRLRAAKKKILPELKATETELNKEFRKRNKAARDEIWNYPRTVEQKATANSSQFLAEAFPKGASGKAKKAKVSKGAGGSPTRPGTLKVVPKSKVPVIPKPEANPPSAARAPRTKQTARKNAFPSPPPPSEPPRRPLDFPDYSTSLHGYSSVSPAKAHRPKQTARKTAFPDSSESESEESPGENSNRSKPLGKRPFHYHFNRLSLPLPKVNILGMFAAHGLSIVPKLMTSGGLRVMIHL